jgi:hypothetical protein
MININNLNLDLDLIDYEGLPEKIYEIIQDNYTYYHFKQGGVIPKEAKFIRPLSANLDNQGWREEVKKTLINELKLEPSDNAIEQRMEEYILARDLDEGFFSLDLEEGNIYGIRSDSCIFYQIDLDGLSMDWLEVYKLFKNGEMAHILIFKVIKVKPVYLCRGNLINLITIAKPNLQEFSDTFYK